MGLSCFAFRATADLTCWTVFVPWVDQAPDSIRRNDWGNNPNLWLRFYLLNLDHWSCTKDLLQYRISLWICDANAFCRSRESSLVQISFPKWHPGYQGTSRTVATLFRTRHYVWKNNSNSLLLTCKQNSTRRLAKCHMPEKCSNYWTETSWWQQCTINTELEMDFAAQL